MTTSYGVSHSEHTSRSIEDRLEALVEMDEGYESLGVTMTHI